MPDIRSFFLTEASHSSDSDNDNDSDDEQPETDLSGFINDELSLSDYSSSSPSCLTLLSSGSAPPSLVVPLISPVHRDHPDLPSSPSSLLSPPPVPDQLSLPVHRKRSRKSSVPLPDLRPSSSPPKRSRKPPSKNSSVSGFCVCSKNLFLTFPQCDFPLDDFFQNLTSRFVKNPDFDRVICCREQHSDGSWHLHAVLLLTTKIQTRSVSFFDNLVQPSKHPNIVSRLKSQANTVKYLLKGGDPSLVRSNFPYDQFLSLSEGKKSSKSLLISSMTTKLMSQSTHSLPDPVQLLDQVVDKVPDFSVLHLRAIRDFIDHRVNSRRRSEFAALQAQKISVRPLPGYSTYASNTLAAWLSLNIRQHRPHRQRQLWVKASPGAGKTTMIHFLTDHFKLSVYYWPTGESWWDSYSDQAYDLIVLDEFKAQKKITDLNPILSGDRYPLSRRSAPPLVKHDNLPVIILSNFTPIEVYHKATLQALNPLLDRLIVIEFNDDPIRLEPGPAPLDPALYELSTALPHLSSSSSSSSSSYPPAPAEVDPISAVFPESDLSSMPSSPLPPFTSPSSSLDADDE